MTSRSDRSKGIATLRAIGFSCTSAFTGTLVEALVLAAVGGVVGSVAAYLLFDGLNAAILGSSFTQVVFSFNLSADAIFQGAGMALVIGLISGIFPAWRAARMPVLMTFQADK